jgi:hypothetical protein
MQNSLNADAPKPPTYPFNTQSVSKSTDTKTAAHQNFWRYCHLASKDFAAFATASDTFRHRFASVRRLLVLAPKTRKQKMTKQ